VITRTLRGVWSPQLKNRRDVDVYLPDSYRGGGRQYPVVYVQDGQNLSDPEKAFAGTWRLEDALDDLAARNLEAIIVGVHHTGKRRLVEYSPYPDRRHGGGDADLYLAFLIDTLKPRIDRLFRTRREREATAILGSSMGGLLSLYGFFRYPSIFGRAGVMSPAIWYGQAAILDFIREAQTPPGRLYVDVGTAEGVGTLRDVRRLGRLLVRKGFTREPRGQARRTTSPPTRRAAERATLRYLEDQGGRHSEGDWARRLGPALEFLLR
jgi:predicted alpha/beta superfamily hydrolase